MFNTELRLHHTHGGIVLSFDDLCQFKSDSNVMETLFDIQSRLQRLNLSDEENCILAALTVTFTGVLKIKCNVFLYGEVNFSTSVFNINKSI